MILRKHYKFLFPSAALAAASLCVSGQTTTPPGMPQISAFTSEASVPLNFVVASATPNIPNEVLAQLQGGTIQARQRITYDPARNVLTVWVFTAAPNDPLPLPQASLPQSTSSRTISLFEMSPECIIQSSSPTPNILFAGRITSNSVSAPFGSLTGATAAVSLGYSTQTPGNFTMIGATVAGSNVISSPRGQGTLTFAGTDGGGTPGDGGGTPGNRAPVVQIVPLPGSTTVPIIALDASASSDPDGDPLTFQWRSIGRPASISNANSAIAQVQLGGQVGEYTFEVTVSDNQGNSSTSRVTLSYYGR